MARFNREVLNADGMTLPIVCDGMGTVGIGISGTWAGTIYFEEATKDNPNVWIASSQTPFPSGTDVSSATANGNWFSPVKANIFARRVRFSRTSGSAIVIMTAATDASYQDAYLSASTVNVSSRATSGQNTLTQTAQANRAWVCKFLQVCFSGVYIGGAASVEIHDGAETGTILFQEFIQPPSVSGSVGWKQEITLPPDGVVATPGNAVTIIVRGFPAQASIVNAQFGAA